MERRQRHYRHLITNDQHFFAYSIQIKSIYFTQLNLKTDTNSNKQTTPK